jgi:hypothetical protein
MKKERFFIYRHGSIFNEYFNQTWKGNIKYRATAEETDYSVLMKRLPVYGRDKDYGVLIA